MKKEFECAHTRRCAFLLYIVVSFSFPALRSNQCQQIYIHNVRKSIRLNNSESVDAYKTKAHMTEAVAFAALKTELTKAASAPETHDT